MKKYLQTLCVYKLLVSSAVFVLSSIVFSSLLLKNLGIIIGAFVDSSEGDKFDFAEIFAQTSHARLSFHWILPLAFGLLFAFLCAFVFSKTENIKAQNAFCICVFLFLLVLSYLSCLLLTKVNGIRFFDLLYKLLPLIDSL